ncbi:hypothetical protein BVC80_8145g4 [Macleaya cordata]|uniref:Uncharacterized protein n=1 Tax=Macleaya cordata TaxID=56857 RepID=A0A200R066_MACCD|nr:hypothetical protein BVC80_8145g4 [Macleaya cordata]
MWARYLRPSKKSPEQMKETRKKIRGFYRSEEEIKDAAGVTLEMGSTTDVSVTLDVASTCLPQRRSVEGEKGGLKKRKTKWTTNHIQIGRKDPCRVNMSLWKHESLET